MNYPWFAQYPSTGKEPSKKRPARETALDPNAVKSVRAPTTEAKVLQRPALTNDLQKSQTERRRLLFRQARVRDMGDRY